MSPGSSRPLSPCCRSRLVALPLLAALAAVPGGTLAAEEEGGAAALAAEGEQRTEAKHDHRFAFTLVPGPVYDPALGWGLVLIPMAMYDVNPADKVSPGSTTMGLGMVTTNGSWGAGMGQKLYLAEDSWRMKGGAGYASVNQRFYGIGDATSGAYVNMTMELAFASVEGLYRIMPKGYAGLVLTYRQSRFLGKDAMADAVIDAAGLNRTWDHSLLPGLRFDYDTRDVQTAPRSGLLGELTLKGASQSWGSSNTYARLSARYSQFHALDEEARHVLAWNLDAEGGFGDVPFDQYPDLGGNKALRGYVRGRYTDKNMLVAQAEWRWSVWRRVGLTVFGGLGKVFPAWDALAQATWLPSGGLGLRYLIIPARRMNARLDLAWGREGPSFYFSVGEAF